MGYKFNPFTGNFDATDSPNGVFDSVEVDGDITLDDGGTYATTLQLITPTANRTISFPDATGTVGLVGGSSGQLVYNNAGAYAGAPSTSVGATGNITLSLAGAASTPPVSLTGTWFSGGTSTTTKPQLLIEPTGTTSTAWSTSGTGLGVNAASGFAGNLLDLQVNGSSKLYISSNGNIAVPSGSQSAPSLTFTGDPNTGIYSPGADQLALSTNGTGRLFVSSLGRIGVGVVSPNALLHAGLTGNAGAPATGTVALFENNTSGSNCYIQINGAFDAESGVVFTDGSQANKGRILYNNATEHMALWTDGSERLRITSAGLVGIGTSSPNKLLHLGNGTATAVEQTLSSAGANGLCRINFQCGSTVTGNILTTANASTLSTGGLVVETTTNHPIVFRTNSSGASIGGNERVRITETGLVGIGATSPGEMLTIGTSAAGGNIRLNSSSAGNNGLIRFYDTAGAERMQLSASTTQATILAAGIPLRFTVGGSEAVRIDSSQRLLVGTSTSITAPDALGTNRDGSLQLAGNLLATTMQGNHFFNATSTGPLYQFTKSNTSTIGSHTVVTANDRLGTFQWSGSDGTNYITAAQIYAQVDGTPGANDMPGRLVFSTTADGASSPTEQLRITSNRYVRLASGTGGIQFNGDTAAANALDDYEEGTWTPVINTSNEDATATWTTGPNARYTKIGRQVHLVLYGGISVSAAGTGYPQITGVPIAATTALFAGALSYASAFNSSGIAPKLYNTTVDILNTNSTNAGPSLQNGYIAMFISYTV